MSGNDYNYPTISFPFGNDVNSYFTTKRDIDVLKTSLYNIVLTSYGERVMMPEFGTIVPKSVFEPVAGLADEIRVDVERAIRTWDPRLTLVDLQVKELDEPKGIKLSITARVNDVPTEQPLVIEFNITP